MWCKCKCPSFELHIVQILNKTMRRYKVDTQILNNVSQKHTTMYFEFTNMSVEYKKILHVQEILTHWDSVSLPLIWKEISSQQGSYSSRRIRIAVKMDADPDAVKLDPNPSSDLGKQPGTGSDLIHFLKI